MGTMNIQSLLQDMVEQCALLDLYCSKVQELKFELKDKDKVIEEIKLTMEQNNVNRAVPDTALKIAAIVESEEKDSVVLASLLKDLIQNQLRDGQMQQNLCLLSFLIMEVRLLPELFKKKSAAQAFKPCTAPPDLITLFRVNWRSKPSDTRGRSTIPLVIMEFLH